MCDVLNEMRKCSETGNYSYLLGLIEEVQTMGNRMEAALEGNNDIESGRRIVKELKNEIEELREKKDELSKSKKS